MALKLLIWGCIFYTCHAVVNVSKYCSPKLTCRECMKVPGCAWCSQEDTFDNPRCFRPNLKLPYISDVCSEEYVFMGTSSIDAESPKNMSKAILPEKISAHLRVGEAMNFLVTVNKLDDALQSSTLKLHHNASKEIQVEFLCLNEGRLTTQCKNTEGGNYVKIQLLECPSDPSNWRQNVIIYSSDVNDFVLLEVQLLCSCPCERKGSLGYDISSRRCNFVGTLQCGICECDPGYAGKHCECTSKQYSKVGCKSTRKNHTLDCSGRGLCICNRCQCDVDPSYQKRISGSWCECDNSACGHHDGKLCGGNGLCHCGNCICRLPWKGKTCDCYGSTKTCYKTKNSKICEGRGLCVCGQCKCHASPKATYVGKYCEICVTCPSACEQMKACVLCQLNKISSYTEKECAKKCNHQVATVDALEENLEDRHLCTVKDESNCPFKFTYKVVGKVLHIEAETNLQC
ncbi:hypothetical protein FQA39_LY13940 [Lamprigera yunnana]|nr:hypothetical protein FQA39_LY13940 [Lamprigera yunnana]